MIAARNLLLLDAKANVEIDELRLFIRPAT
jgi:hypothetical protein